MGTQILPQKGHSVSQYRFSQPFWCRLTEVVVEKRPLNGCRVALCYIQAELSRVTEELRLAEEAQRNSEAARHRLETELREMAVRLEQAEYVALREGKRIVVKLQNRVRYRPVGVYRHRHRLTG